MDQARAFVRAQRALNALDAAVASVKERHSRYEQAVRDLVEAEDLPPSFRCDEANVHIRKEVWAGPKDGHESLCAVLEDLGLEEYLPNTVHAGKISAYVREHIDNAEKPMTIEERLRSPEPKPIDPRLLDALKITEKYKAVAHGAGS